MIFDVNRIREILPHRYPFLLVDRVVELEPGKRIVGYKNLSANEPFFQGHFPEVPLMPGVLQIEAMAQLGGILIATDPAGGSTDGKVAVLASIDKVKLRRAVVPGDQFVMEVKLVRRRGPFGEAEATASVDGQLVAEGQIRFALVPKDSLKAGAGAKG